MLFVSAAIPFVVGAIYYGPLFGKSWMSSLGITEKDLEGANMGTIFGASYVFNLLLSLGLMGLTIHQMSVIQLMANDASLTATGQQFLSEYGGHFRSFKHGALHGAIAAIMFALPVVGVNALFERRSWKNIFIHAGYWLIALSLMGGFLCATLKFDMF